MAIEKSHAPLAFDHQNRLELFERLGSGYRNHISIVNKNNAIRHYTITSAEVHDGLVFEVLLDESNSSSDVWAEAAYHGNACDQSLSEAKYRNKIHRLI